MPSITRFTPKTGVFGVRIDKDSIGKGPIALPKTQKAPATNLGGKVPGYLRGTSATQAKVVAKAPVVAVKFGPQPVRKTTPAVRQQLAEEVAAVPAADQAQPVAPAGETLPRVIEPAITSIPVSKRRGGLPNRHSMLDVEEVSLRYSQAPFIMGKPTGGSVEPVAEDLEDAILEASGASTDSDVDGDAGPGLGIFGVELPYSNSAVTYLPISLGYQSEGIEDEDLVAPVGMFPKMLWADGQIVDYTYDGVIILPNGPLSPILHDGPFFL